MGDHAMLRRLERGESIPLDEFTRGHDAITALIIESNGLLFGVRPEGYVYPVCAMPVQSGDRFLLYTDGLTEPENAQGDSFGDGRIEQVLRENEGRPPSALSDALLAELRRWQPASAAQQDDITLIVVDVL